MISYRSLLLSTIVLNDMAMLVSVLIGDVIFAALLIFMANLLISTSYNPSINVTFSHRGSKEPMGYLPYSRDTSTCTPLYNQM